MSIGEIGGVGVCHSHFAKEAATDGCVVKVMAERMRTLAGSCGRVESWKVRAVTGSSDRLNWSYLRRALQAFKVSAAAQSTLASHVIGA